MKTIFRIFSLVVAMTLFAGAAYGAKMFYSTSNNPSSWSSSVTPTQDGANYTATITGLTAGTQYYIALSTTDAYSGVYYSDNTACSYVVNSGVQIINNVLQIGSQNYNTDGKRFQFIWLRPEGTSIVASYNNDTHVYTISSGATMFTVSTSVTGGKISPTSASVPEGGNAEFTVTPTDGYIYASSSMSDGSTVVRDGNKFTVSPTTNATLTVTYSAQTFTVTAGVYDGPGSVSPTQMQNVAYGSSIDFNVVTETGYYVDQERTTYTGSAEKVFTQGKISLENIKSAGELKVYFKNDERPTVYVGAYPTQGTGSNANNVNLDGYLADRHCQTVTAAGFYWKSNKDISLSEVETAIGGGAGASNLISATVIPATAGTSFNHLNYNLNLQQNQEVFIVAYATAGGNTNISKVIGFKYQPCNGIEGVTLTPATAELPTGFSNTFSAVARGAGKSPVYAWYDNDALISDQTGQTLTYTMPDANTHIIKVTVSEADCGSSANATVDVTTCAAPTVALSASKTSDTPWQPITITAAVTNSLAGVWSVTPEAELNVDGLNAILNATVLSGEQTVYTVTYTAENDCDNALFTVSESIQITIVKDHEDCTSPQ